MNVTTADGVRAQRLNGARIAALGSAPPGLSRPAYDRDAARVAGGIVHLGVGAFHRAHQAVAFDTLLARGHAGFSVTGVSLRQLDVPEQLNPQDGLYGVLRLDDAEAPALRIIGAIDRVLHAPTERETVIAALADPRTWLVTLTITEKGYGHRPADGRLDPAHPDIAQDLANPDAPRSAIGLLVAALSRREAAGLPPPIVLCCDNLPANGRLLRGLVLDYAARMQPGLMPWLDAHGVFPCTMVDRIVPATTPDDHAAVAALWGIEDAGLVKAEPFSQWVVEALDPRLAPLANAGVQLVDDVAPFELAKLRLLNGSHSLIAYLGYLGGHAHVADAMAEPGMRSTVSRLMRDEVAPTLPATPGLDLEAYRVALLARFANRALQHRTWQIAMDGSQKIPQRWLGTVAARRSVGARVPVLAAALAAWVQYVSGRDLTGQPIDVRDPLASALAARARHDDPAAAVRSVFAERAVFPPALADDVTLIDDVSAALRRLRRDGVAATLAALSLDEASGRI
ncbi:MAG: mannitol dehydrogenase family protein [Silanimonas sp.]